MNGYIVLASNRGNDDADWRIFTGRNAFIDARYRAKTLAKRWDIVHVRAIGLVEYDPRVDH